MAAATETVMPSGSLGEGDNSVGQQNEYSSLQAAYIASMAEVNPQTYLTDIPEDEELREFIRQVDVDSIDNDGDDENDDMDKDHTTIEGVDTVFEEIRERIEKSQQKAESVASFYSDDSDDKQMMISEHYTSIPFGIQPRDTYEHGKKNADIMGLTYNSRMRQFVILDGKGITTWKRDHVDLRVQRTLMYPKYEYRLLTYLVYAKKYNCYFALSKDFSLKVLNRDFDETCAVSAGLRSVLFMLFNPVRDELITGGVGGTKIWKFGQCAESAFYELKPLANYKLTLRYELPNVGGSWVKRVELDQHLQHLYCCSETDLHVYDLTGQQLFKFERAHTMSITGCVYSTEAKVLITSSVDCEVKVWSLMGGMVHSFRGHSRAVTSLILHPDSSMILITASLDGSIRMWSLDTMDLLYSLVVSSDGVLWMGLTDDNILYISTCRNITLWSLNQFYRFWALSRNRVTKLSLVGHEGKTTRIMAEGDDSSMRLFSRKTKKNLTTVLPPHVVGALERVLCVCYSRENNLVFVLINPTTVWVYTTRTDPSCRIGVWDIHELQVPYLTGAKGGDKGTDRKQGGTVRTVNKGIPLHRATENGMGVETLAGCISLCNLNSSAMMWTDEGNCCPLHHSYLLLGLDDGRILFMDPVVKGEKYMEFKAAKDGILMMEHDIHHMALVTLSNVSNSAVFNIWDLPTLTLLHEVYCENDVQHFTRLAYRSNDNYGNDNTEKWCFLVGNDFIAKTATDDYSFLTGHASGGAYFHYLLPTEDTGPQRTKDEDEKEDEKDLSSNCRKLDHNSPIVALDSSTSLRLFCSASAEGALKIWDEFCVLVTEIMFEESLSAACFLNNKGDILVGFKNHIYFIDHSKVCPHMKQEEVLPDDEADKESDILEDPDVLYEVRIHKTEEVTLENYLVPFKLDFSKDFLEGNIPIKQEEKEEEESSESESDYSLAPTDIYLSPADSPSRLSEIDLTLGAEVSKYDLLKQMEHTMKLMEKKAREAALKKQKKKHLSPRKRKKHVSIFMGDEPFPSDREDTDKEDAKFELPAFGASPGPTPIATPPTRPSSPVEFMVQPEILQPPAEKPPLIDLEDFKPVQLPQDGPDLLDCISTEPEIEYVPPKHFTDFLPEDRPVPNLNVKSKYNMSVLDSKPNPPLVSTDDDDDVPDIVPTAYKQSSKRRKERMQHLKQVKEKLKEKNTIVDKAVSDIDNKKVPDDNVQAVRQEKVPLAMSTISFPQPEEETPNGGTALIKEDVPKHIPKTERKPFEEEEEEVPTRRSKYSMAMKNVDVKGLMRPQSKRLSARSRLTSPSPVRKNSDHSHGGVLTEEALKQLQLQNQEAVKKSKQMRERKQMKRGQKLTRQELIEQQRQQKEAQEQQQKFKLGQLPPHLYSSQPRPDQQQQQQQEQEPTTTDYPMVQFEKDIDDFQDMMWDGNGDSKGGGGGLMGTKLVLPPSRMQMDKSRLMKPPPLPKVPPRPNADSDKNKTLNQVPSVPMGESPTQELDRASLFAEVKPQPIEETKDVKGRASPIKLLSEYDRDEILSPDIETAIGKDFPRSTTPANGTLRSTAAIKKLSDQHRNAKPLKVVLPRENEFDDDASRASPVSEITEEQIAKYMKALDEPEEPSLEYKKKRRSSRGGGILIVEEKNVVRARPYTSFHRRQTPEPVLHQDRVRPSTAHVHFQAEDLQSAFDDAFQRYQTHPGTPTTVTKNKLYRNDGTTFEDNWQERVIERHMLLKMQKELRCKSAAQRRQAMEEKKNERFRTVSHTDVMTEDGSSTPHSDIPRQQCSTLRVGDQHVWANTTGELDRIKSFVSQRAPQATVLPLRPHTAHAAMQSTPRAEKNELKSEKPFRFKMGKDTPSLSRQEIRERMTKRKPAADPSIDPKLIDPRNPSSFRPVSTKSIPSKCNRYMLVSRPKEKINVPLPSPMEEQLLAERFPNMGMKVYRHHSDIALKSKKVSYCIEYTPFQSLS